MWLLLPIFTLLTFATSGATAQTDAPTDDAYLDQTARVLIHGLQAARDAERESTRAYAAVIRERMGIMAPGFQRDRPLASGERTVRVRWAEDRATRTEVLAARFRHAGAPYAAADGEISEPDVERFTVEPFGDPFRFGFGPPIGAELGADRIAVRSPLASDAHAHYQFRSGDTVAVVVDGPDGGVEVEAVEVTVIPRYRSIGLVAARLWIDAETGRLIRAAYRSAKKIDREVRGRLHDAGQWQPRVWIDAGNDAADNVAAGPTNGLFARLINLGASRVAVRIEMDVNVVVVDYQPRQPFPGLPRSATWSGFMTWENVTATGYVAPGTPWQVDWEIDVDESGAAAVPVDSLPPPIWRRGQNAERAGSLPSPWDVGTRDALENALVAVGTGSGGDASDGAAKWLFLPPIAAVSLLRYNPIEGFAAGTLLRRDVGWWRTALLVRAGTRAWQIPDMDFTVQRDHPNRRVQLSLYRALRAGPLGVGGLHGLPGYLVLDGSGTDFHWSHGATIRFLPGNGQRNSLALGMVAERDTYVDTEDRRDRVGAFAEWKPWWGALAPGEPGWGANLLLRGSAGDYPHVRAVAEGAAVLPLSHTASAGFRIGAAKIWGDPAPQDLWRLVRVGGWLRGHGGSPRSMSMQMATLDLQRRLGWASLSVFTDWVRADGPDYCAFGGGLVLMQGVIRLDVARGFGCGNRGGPGIPGWRFNPGGLTFF